MSQSTHENLSRQLFMLNGKAVTWNALLGDAYVTLNRDRGRRALSIGVAHFGSSQKQSPFINSFLGAVRWVLEGRNVPLRLYTRASIDASSLLMSEAEGRRECWQHTMPGLSR